MTDAGVSTRKKLLDWILTLLERSEDCWNRSQRDFLDSLLHGQEGTKTLAELAVTSARLKSTGVKPEKMGGLREVLEAIEDFWNDPSPETYENLRATGQSLDSDA